MPITIDIEQSPFYKEVLEKGLKTSAINLYKKLKLQPEQIAEVLGVEKEKVLKWLKEEGMIG
ncbi:hypothetical protein JCM9492_00310 [Aquifex pyrophilus]